MVVEKKRNRSQDGIPFCGECHVGEPRTRPSAYRDRLQLDVIHLTMSLVPKGSDPSMTSGPFFIFESAV